MDARVKKRVDTPVHTPESAPGAARDMLLQSKSAYGFVPNLHGVMAEAPALLKAYQALSAIFSETTFSPAEQQVVLLAVSFENGCDYCMAAHSVIAGMQKVPEAVVEALREGREIGDPRLEALRRFVVTVVQKRGWLSESDVDDFLQAGFTQAQVLEVILGVGYKTLSNYTNHVAATPLDEAFAAAAWKKAG